MNKESFLIYKSFYEPIKHLKDEQLGKLFRSIFEYQINKINDVDDDIKIAFEFFKNQFRFDEKKYVEICKRNQENGKRGGRPKKVEETQKTQVVFEKPKKADNDNVNVNENDNVNDIINYYMQKINSAMTSIEYEKLKPYIECFEERLDIIKYAIDVSVMNKARNINYLISILKNYKDNDVKTMSDIEDLEEKHRNSKKNPNDATYERVTQNYQKEELSEEDKAVMQELMDFFDE